MRNQIIFCAILSASISSVFATDIETRVANNENKQSGIEQRVTSVEAKNTEQDAELSKLSDRVSDLEEGGGGSTPTYSVPIVVDAEGIYVGTFLAFVRNTRTNNGYEIMKKGSYRIVISEDGLVGALTAAYDTSDCSGDPTVISKYSADRNHNNIFRLLASRAPIDTASNNYYLPSNYAEVLYKGYFISDFEGVVTCRLYEEEYVKPSLNDASVTGYDDDFLRNLAVPLRISIEN